MKKKAAKVIIPIFISLILIVGVAIGAAYCLVRFGELPVSVPYLIEGRTFVEDIPNSSQMIMDQWRDVIIYYPPEKIESVRELMDTVELTPITDTELQGIFSEINSTSLTEYLKDHSELVEAGYERLFIDGADLYNTPTGIYTVMEDDVLVIDAIDGITISGRDLIHDGLVSKAKIAIIHNLDQLHMGITNHPAYWEFIDFQSLKNEAVLSINASGYTWNDIGNYAILYGAVKYQGDVKRKPMNIENIIAFTEEGYMSIGTPIEEAYNAVEFIQPLIVDGEIVYEVGEDEVESLSAQTAIGQMADGTTIFVVASGGLYGSDIGASYSDILQIMLDYGAVNASMLSGGSRTMMYWNGRTINETIGYESPGVRLPNTLYVSYYSDKAE